MFDSSPMYKVAKAKFIASVQENLRNEKRFLVRGFLAKRLLFKTKPSNKRLVVRLYLGALQKYHNHANHLQPKEHPT